jgi:ATP/maltotriose-dependent transcriptional regulator MalT
VVRTDDTTRSIQSAGLMTEPARSWMGEPVVLERVLPPAWRRGLISRPRLLALLDKSIRLGRLTSICAPAGFGKTVLMADYVRHSPVGYVWLRLDPMDRDPSRLLLSLSQAIDASSGRGGAVASTSDLAGALGRQCRLVTPVLLANRLAAGRLEQLVVLDDFDEVADSPGAVGILVDLLALTGDHIHIATISRSPVPEPLFRCLPFDAPAGIVGSDNLRFDRSDAEELFQSLAVPDEDWPALHRRLSACEGWPAALALALKGIELGGFARAAGDTAPHALFDLMLTTVLTRLDPGDRDMLMRLSSLEIITPDLCETALGLSNCWSTTVRLGRATPLLEYRPSDHAYRVPGLVGQFMRRRHGTACDLSADQHRRAAAWVAAHGNRVAAIRHSAAAGDLQEAAEALGELLPELVQSARWHAILDLTALIGDSTPEQSVGVALAKARAQMAIGDAKGAVPTASRAIEAAQRGSTMHVDLLLTRSFAHRSSGDFLMASADATEALAVAGSITPSQHVKVLRVLASVRASNLEIASATACLAEARLLAEKHDLKWQRVLAISDSATLDCIRGRFLLAADRAQQAIGIAGALPYPEGRALATTNLGLAQIGNGDYSSGIQTIENVLAESRSLDSARCEALAWAAMGDISLDLSDHIKSSSCYRRGLAIARAIDDHDLMAHTLRGLAVAMGNRGNIGAARAAMSEAIGSGTRGHLEESRSDLAEGTLFLIEGRARDARTQLAKAVETLRDSGAVADLARALVYFGYAVFLADGMAAAMPMLEEAARAVSEMDSNACVVAPAAQMPRLWGVVDAAGRADLRRAIAEPDRRPRRADGRRGPAHVARWDDPDPDVLSERERELVICLCMGLSRDEVATRLSRSRSTVDKAISTVYASTGFTSAYQVVAWAHRCGLFSPSDGELA